MENKDIPTLTLCELSDPRLPRHESYSPFCLKIHRALVAMELPFMRRFHDSALQLKRYSATGQAPVLLVGDEYVQDSTDILRRVLPMAPRPLATSAEAWLWEELADTSINGFLVAARWADERNWPLTRAAYFATMPSLVRAILPARIRRRVLGSLHARDVIRGGMTACWRRFGTLLDQLEWRAPVEKFWLGDGLSVADVALFAQLHSFRTSLTAWQANEVARRPRLSAWLDRVDAATAKPASSERRAA